MKLGDGVEQAIHSATMLAVLTPGQTLSAAALAEFHGVSQSYLLKHLQTLSRARILDTVPGPKGGYKLARQPAEISLLDIVLALEGTEPAFRCKEIRQNGPAPLPQRYFKAPCQVSAAMLRAERAYRAELRAVSLADLLEQVAREDHDGAINDRGCAFLERHARQSKSAST